MNTKIIYLAIMLLSLNSYSQKNNLDIRTGVGYTLLGSGDMKTINYESEINYKLNNYFTTSGSFNFGKSDNGNLDSSSFLQGNLNLFISPFKNNKKNDLRLGIGLSYYGISDTDIKEVNISYSEDHKEFEKRKSWGNNIIIENTYTLKDKYLIGLKVFTQPYFNNDINSGIMLKLGFKL